MTKVFKTDQRQVFFIFKESKGKAEITKCKGYMSDGVFMGTIALDKRIVAGLDLMTIRYMLEDYFKPVYEEDIIADMRKRLESRD